MLTRFAYVPMLLASALLFGASTASADPQRAACAVSIVPGGELVSLSGTATAVDNCGGSRNLSCGHSLFAGESVSTSADSTAGVMVGEVLVVVGPDSAASIGVNKDGTPNVALERGRVRVIDPRDGGALAQLRAGNASASFVGNDAEATLTASGATLCGWNTPLEVARTGQPTRTPARCSDALLGGPAIGLASAEAGGATCEPRMRISALTGLVPLPPVAGGPPGVGPTLPTVEPAPPRSPCDNPGSGCAGPTGATGITVNEQPVGNAPFPGGGGSFPGGGGGFPGNNDI